MAQTVIGLFDDNSEARRVVDDLHQHGFSKNEVTVTRDSDSPTAQQLLTDARVPSQDMNFYNEGVRRGGSLVMVRTENQKAQQAADIMSRYNMVDLDSRLAEYSTAGAKDIGLSHLDNEGNVLQVIEEELQVGKRQVQRGGVRIHTFVTERPVEEQVTLRDETVSVERRPVNREVTNADAMFKEQSFEVRETDEEAVVSKQARVTEEVVVGKQVGERTETVRDTVRRQDVDVEDARTTGTTTATDYDTDYRSFYDKNYASSGNNYDYYSPGFRYGQDLASSDQYRGKDWSSVESNVRTQWEQRNPGTWEQFKDSIRYAWDRATNKR